MAQDLGKIKWEDLVSRVLANLSERNRDVVTRRFGIGEERPETLESIGDSYGITRERVRQIEKFSLNQIRKEEHMKLLEGARRALADYIAHSGNLIREERLLAALPREEDRNRIVLVLTLGDEFTYVDDHDLFHPVWVIDDEALRLAENLVRHLRAEFEREARLLDEAEVIERMREKAARKIDEDAAHSYIDAALHFEPTMDGKWGLSHWIEIRPRGMRDKAYLVTRNTGRPLHFREISDLINKTRFSQLAASRNAHPQTVHNELIKDDRFVLVGRGLYALREWGYAPGTVRDVIRGVLKESGEPLDRDEVIDRTLKQRLVKVNTILLNLQDKKHFRRLEDDRYYLA